MRNSPRTTLPNAQALASSAVRNSPLSVHAVRVLAMVADLEHRHGMDAWRLASAMGWRDPPTQFWAMQQALVNHEYATAAIRADALMRTSNDVGTCAVRRHSNVREFCAVSDRVDSPSIASAALVRGLLRGPCRTRPTRSWRAHI